MPPLGAHMSIAGGFHKAVEAASSFGMDTVQIFTHSPSQWSVGPEAGGAGARGTRAAKRPRGSSAGVPGGEIAPELARQFQQRRQELGIGHPLAHASYLINLAAPQRELWKRSIAAFIAELHRAACLGIPYVVLHPGSYTTSSESAGLKAIVKALNEIDRQTHALGTTCLLETTAGQGSSLGCRFDHLAAILAGVRNPDRLGFCFDTCHVFAAGYPLTARADYLATMRSFDHLVGLSRIRAFHLNDSKRGLGSRIDRHEHIGRGQLGLAAFGHLLRDRRFRRVPMYLETPKGKSDGLPWDAVNLAALRALLAGRSPSASV